MKNTRRGALPLLDFALSKQLDRITFVFPPLRVKAFHRSIPLLCSGLFVMVVMSCASISGTSRPTVTADSGNAQIKDRLIFHLRDLEIATKMRYRGKSIHLVTPTPAFSRDWREMPVAKIRGKSQGGLTSWRVIDRQSTVYFAQWKGHIPDWLIRHEALHVILLSHGITGHPEEFAQYFARPYWWLPEEHFKTKSSSQH